MAGARGAETNTKVRERPSPWREARLVSPAAASRAHAERCGLFTSRFCYFSTAAPEGAATHGLPGSYTLSGTEE